MLEMMNNPEMKEKMMEKMKNKKEGSKEHNTNKYKVGLFIIKKLQLLVRCIGLSIDVNLWKN